MNYDTIPSLPRLFFDQAQKLGAKPFLWRKEESRVPADPLEPRRRRRARAGARPDRPRRQAGRPRRADRGEPAGMADLRPRHHGGRRDHRAGLLDQHRRRQPARPHPQRRARGHHLQSRHRQARPAGLHAGAGAEFPDRDGEPEPDPAAAAALPQLERGDEPGRPEARRRHRGAGRRAGARRDLLHHLHLRHRRRAQGRDAHPRLDPVQHQGRLQAAAGSRHGQRRVPVVPAAVAFLRAHGGPVPADLHRRADLLRREHRQADRQHGRSQADHHDRGAAAL